MKQTYPSETRVIHSAEDLLLVRKTVRQWTSYMKFNLVEQTKVITAISELARNVYQYAHYGTLKVEMISEGALQLTIEDKGPGIPHLEKVLRENKKNKGIAGAKNLVNQLNIKSVVGEGTLITVTHRAGQK